MKPDYAATDAAKQSDGGATCGTRGQCNELSRAPERAARGVEDAARRGPCVRPALQRGRANERELRLMWRFTAAAFLRLRSEVGFS